ncbi:MAG: flagellar motor switch protein FliN, partial [Chloroflexota bacterium]
TEAAFDEAAIDAALAGTPTEAAFDQAAIDAALAGTPTEAAFDQASIDAALGGSAFEFVFDQAAIDAALAAATAGSSENVSAEVAISQPPPGAAQLNVTSGATAPAPQPAPVVASSGASFPLIDQASINAALSASGIGGGAVPMPSRPAPPPPPAPAPVAPPPPVVSMAAPPTPAMSYTPPPPPVAPQRSADEAGLDLLLDVPLQVSVELGRTRLTVTEILSLRVGSVLELDKMAGEPGDVLVNGTLIARGEVVVVDEKFGIRIVEVLPTARRLASVA